MREPRWLDDAEAGRHLRPYAITGGRTRHSRHTFTLITLVVSRSTREARHEDLEPESAQILGLCRDRAVAVAEIAAHLDLPVSVVKILCGICSTPHSSSSRPRPGRTTSRVWNSSKG